MRFRIGHEAGSTEPFGGIGAVSALPFAILTHLSIDTLSSFFL